MSEVLENMEHASMKITKTTLYFSCGCKNIHEYDTRTCISDYYRLLCCQHTTIRCIKNDCQVCMKKDKSA